MVEASCFQASRVGVEGTAARLGVGPSREDAMAEVTGGAGGDEGAKEGLVSAAEAGKGASVFPFAAPPSVRKWKLQEAERGSQPGGWPCPSASGAWGPGGPISSPVQYHQQGGLGELCPPIPDSGSWSRPNYTFLL